MGVCSTESLIPSLSLPLDVYWFLPNICLLHVHLHHSWELAFSAEHVRET